MTDQGKFGYPYCPNCNAKLKDTGLRLLQSEKPIQCTYCGTKVTVVSGWFKPKIKAWEIPEESHPQLP
jgi:DNA-directed RNA polymerase subunit RPC12/RpoP